MAAVPCHRGRRDYTSTRDHLIRTTSYLSSYALAQNATYCHSFVSVRRERGLASESAYFDHVTPSEPSEPATRLPCPLLLSRHRLVLVPLIFHPRRQQIEAILQEVKAVLLVAHHSSPPKTCRSPTSHRPTSSLKKPIVPRSTRLTLPLAVRSSVWTSQEFWKDSGVYRIARFCFVRFLPYFNFDSSALHSTSTPLI